MFTGNPSVPGRTIYGGEEVFFGMAEDRRPGSIPDRLVYWYTCIPGIVTRYTTLSDAELVDHGHAMITVAILEYSILTIIKIITITIASLSIAVVLSPPCYPSIEQPADGRDHHGESRRST